MEIEILLEYFCQPGRMKVFAQTIKLAETHNQRIPFVGVDVMSLFRIQDGFVNVNANNVGLDRHGKIIRLAEWMELLDDGFKLYRTLRHSRRSDDF